MRYFIFILVIFSTVNYSAYGQQDPQYSQYMFNTLAVNPAYAGSRDVVSATALFRKQWVNTPGSPATGTFSVDAPFKRERVGVGLVAFNDRIGVTSTSGVYGSYAFRIRLKKGTLALGLQAGFSQFKADYSSVVLDQNNQYDGAFVSNVNKFMPNFGGGVYYKTDKFYLGLSLPRFLDNGMFKKSDAAVTIQSYQSRQVFLMGGFVVALSQDVKLKPSTLIKYVQGAPLQMDINANVWFYDVVAAGLSYRAGAGTLVSMIEIQATKQIRIGYAYDAGFGKIRSIGQSSHEIMARYEFGYVKAKILSPRYF
ncbi:MAG TPA: type IX secretion system membrane protein PorP/SprF [Cytophagaceae bacterium]|jgi:type IX secretion system PorP/SprF family membrane protein|nr:type IX secretion system membrane protein PorP/SprF [Cytophagaceae bacterium]